MKSNFTRVFFLISGLFLITGSAHAQWTGDGTSVNPYQIITVADLKAISDFVMSDPDYLGSKTLGKYWKLMNDIDMAGINDFIPIGGWSSITESSDYKVFAGTFDGNGKVIRNLVINKSSNNYVGLFGCIFRANIINLGIEGGSFIGASYVGGLAGLQYTAAIINSYSSATITGNDYAGVLVGCSYFGNTLQCFSTGAVTGTGNYIGGLTGYMSTGIIINCYSRSLVTATGSSAIAGGLIGYQNKGLTQNSLSIPGELNTSDNIYKGTFIGNTDGSSMFNNNYYSIEIEGYNGTGFSSSPVAGITPRSNDEIKTFQFVSQLNACTNPVVWQYLVNDYPFLKWQNISGAVNPTCVSVIANQVTGVSKTGAILNGTYDSPQGGEIVLSAGFRVYTGSILNPSSSGGTDYNATLSNNFTCNINSLIQGMNYSVFAFIQTVSGIYYSGPKWFSTALWEGLGTNDEPYLIYNPQDLIALSEFVMNDPDNSINNTYKNSNNKYWKMMNDIDFSTVNDFIPIGGWVHSDSTSSNKSFAGNFNGNNKVIRNLVINKPIQHEVGFFGLTNNAIIQNLGVEGGSFIGLNDVGGMVGHQYYGLIDNCYSITNIEGTNVVGGLVGLQIFGQIINSYSKCTVTGTVNELINGIGGLVGYQFCEQSGFENFEAISNCYSASTVTGTGPEARVGGLVGDYSFGTIKNSYSVSSVSGSGSSARVGGFAGIIHSQILNCFSAPIELNAETALSKGIFAGYISDDPNALMLNNYYLAMDGYNVSASFEFNKGFSPRTIDEIKTLSFASQLNGCQNPPAWKYVPDNLPALNWQDITGSTSFSCIPTVYTDNVTNIRNTTATLNGRFIGIVGSETVNSVGFRIFQGSVILPPSSNGNDYVTSLNSSFIINLNELIPNTQYTVFAYIETPSGRYYGNAIRFTTLIWEGIGSSEDPYLIYSVSDLKELSNLVLNDPNQSLYYLYKNTYNKYWKLMNDIDFTGVYDFIPIGGWGSSTTTTEYRSFAGTFDGDGKIIRNLTINKPSNSYVSLFGFAYNATIKNIGIEGFNFSGLTYVGGLVGHQALGTISNCYSKGSVTAIYSSAYIGGLVGYQQDGAINNCYSLSSITCTGSSARVGGLIGIGNNGTTNNCYSAPTAMNSNESPYAGLFAGTYSGTASNNYYSVEIAEYDGIGYPQNLVGFEPRADDDMKTLSFTSQMNYCQDPSVWQFVEDMYPVLKWQNISGAMDPHCIPHINTGNVINNGLTAVMLHGDYNCNSVCESVIMVGFRVFEGIIFSPLLSGGTDYVAASSSNFSYDLSGLTQGINYTVFAYLETSSGRYFGSAKKFTASPWEGSGTSESPFLIYTIEDLKALSYYVMNDPSSDEAYYSKNTYAKYWKLMNNIDMAGVTDFIPIGGWENSSLSTVNKSFAGTFDGNYHVVKNLEIMKPSNVYVGLFGYATNAYIQNLGVLDGNVHGLYFVGGLIGKKQFGMVSGCYSTCSVNCDGNDGGGLIGGQQYGFITNSYSISSVTAGGEAGGLIGLNDNGFIQDSYSAGFVIGSSCVGGFVGINMYGTISNCFSRSFVNASEYVGGFVGILLGGNISNCYTAPALKNNSTANTNGIFLGYYFNQGTLANNFYSTAITEYDGVGVIGSISGLSGKTETDLRSEEMIVLLNNSQSPLHWKKDFIPNKINEGFPVLTWQQLPTLIVKTDSVTNITDNSATLSGRVYNGTSSVMFKGFKWRMSSEAQWNFQNIETSEFLITFQLQNLLPNTNYQICAFGTTANDTISGLKLNFTTLLSTEKEPEIIGNFYYRVFPNPVLANHPIHIQTDLTQELYERTRIRLYSMKGDLIKDSPVENDLILEAPANKGIYILEISEANIRIKRFKIIVL